MQPCGWADTPGVATSLLNFSNVFSGNFRTMEEGAYTIIWFKGCENGRIGDLLACVCLWTCPNSSSCLCYSLPYDITVVNSVVSILQNYHKDEMQIFKAKLSHEQGFFFCHKRYVFCVPPDYTSFDSFVYSFQVLTS
ncbi:uncharacterized protein [Henckelia pumila]|uniref:uncharacterized protein isoform X1 n=1 Tax=Henckelia pumila TaxID=405737 RepID=UPI003C6E09C9